MLCMRNRGVLNGRESRRTCVKVNPELRLPILTIVVRTRAYPDIVHVVKCVRQVNKAILIGIKAIPSRHVPREVRGNGTGGKKRVDSFGDYTRFTKES